MALSDIGALESALKSFEHFANENDGMEAAETFYSEISSPNYPFLMHCPR